VRRLCAERDICGTLRQTASKAGNPASRFGKQVKKERLAKGWLLEDLARETGISIAHLSRIENGKRPPTEVVAAACDRAFPHRKDWFTEYYFDLQACAGTPACPGDSS
jgi:hypothetical protein